MEKETKKVRMVVIDSSIFVDFLRQYGPSVAFFKSISKDERKDILFSAITETELISGKSCEDKEVKNIVLGMLNSFNKIDIDNQTALKAGDLSRTYGLDVPDAIIAATSLINNAELLTRNINDFKNIKELKVKSPY